LHVNAFTYTQRYSSPICDPGHSLRPLKHIKQCQTGITVIRDNFCLASPCRLTATWMQPLLVPQTPSMSGCFFKARFTAKVLLVKFDDVIHGDNGIAMQFHHGTNCMPNFQVVLRRTPIHLARKTEETPLLEVTSLLPLDDSSDLLSKSKSVFIQHRNF
jgi:hypothetical protein